MTQNEIVEAFRKCDHNHDGIACQNCIYRHPQYGTAWKKKDSDDCCYDYLKRDILALLMFQEARLLTYEDFHSGREDSGEAIPCWKEARSKTRRSGWAVIVYGKMLADRETGVARYWTARPTEEQMREEAWPGA